MESPTSWVVPVAEVIGIAVSVCAGVYALLHDFKDANGKITTAGCRGIRFIVVGGLLSLVVQIGEQVDQREKDQAAAEAAAADARRMASLTEEVLALQRFIDFARIRRMAIPLVDRWTEASGVHVEVRLTFVGNTEGTKWLLLGDTHLPLAWSRPNPLRPDSALIVVQALDLRILPPDDHQGRPATFDDLVESVASMEVLLQPTVRDPLGRTVPLSGGSDHPEALPGPVTLNLGRGRGLLLSFWRGGPDVWESRPRVFP